MAKPSELTPAQMQLLREKARRQAPAPQGPPPTDPQGAPARHRRIEREKEWMSKWGGYDLGTVPAEGNREWEEIQSEYRAAEQAEQGRVATAKATKERAKVHPSRLKEIDPSVRTPGAKR